MNEQAAYIAGIRDSMGDNVILIDKTKLENLFSDAFEAGAQDASWFRVKEDLMSRALQFPTRYGGLDAPSTPVVPDIDPKKAEALLELLASHWRSGTPFEDARRLVLADLELKHQTKAAGR